MDQDPSADGLVQVDNSSSQLNQPKGQLSSQNNSDQHASPGQDALINGHPTDTNPVVSQPAADIDASSQAAEASERDAAIPPSVGATNEQARTASLSISAQNAHPKKFTSLNVNKRFLEKASPTPSVVTPSALKPGSSGSPLPSARLSSPSLASRLTSAKLSSVPKVQPAGWVKSAPTAVKMSPTASAGSSSAAAGPLPSEVSTTAAALANAASTVAASPKPAPAVAASTNPPSSIASPRLVTMGRDHSPRSSASGLDLGQGRASPGLRNAALGSSLRAASPASASKAPWANLKPSPGLTEKGQRRPGSMLSDFPTAAEAAKAKQEQEEKAAVAAAKEAARQQAVLQNLDRFRGTALGSGNHWDEMEDEDGGFLGEVVEFADGTQYKIPTSYEDHKDQGPVSKEDRFRDVSHDRSWPPTSDDKVKASPPAWGPRTVRETPSHAASSAEAQPQPRARQDHKPEKMIIPTGSASISLRSPIENRDQGYGYGTRERRGPPQYGQAYRQDPHVPAPAASAARAWGPLAQRQASLNPGAPPPAPPAQTPVSQHPAAQQKSAPIAPQAAPARGPPPHILAGRAPGHANRPLPPHLAQGAVSAPMPHVEESVGRKISFPTPPEPRRAPLPEAGASQPPLASWGPRASARQLENASVPPSGPAAPSAAPAAAEEDDMRSAIERARKRRQQEEEARQAEKERARQKALALEVKMKAAEVAKQEEESKKAAAAALQRSEEEQRGQQQVTAKDDDLRRSGSAATAASWRVPKETNTNGRPSPSQVAGQVQSADGQPQPDLWRPQGRRQQRGEADHSSRLDPTDDRHLRANGPISPRQARANLAGKVPFTRELPPHVALAGGAPSQASTEPLASRPGMPQPSQRPLPPASKGDEADTWRKPCAANEQRATPQDVVRQLISLSQQRPEVQSRTILSPLQRPAGPSSPTQARSDAFDSLGSHGRLPREQNKQLAGRHQQHDTPKIILSRDGTATTGAPGVAARSPEQSSASLPPQLSYRQQQRAERAERKLNAQKSAAGQSGQQDPQSQRAEPSMPKQPASPPVPVEPLTKVELPADRPPVWNRYVVSVKPSRSKPRLNKGLQKAQAARAAAMNTPVRPVYPLTWEPPMVHLSIKTLSRDDQFFPKKYQRGTVITPISMPTKTLPRGLAPIVFPSRGSNAKAGSNGLRKQARFDLSPQGPATLSPTSGISPVLSPAAGGFPTGVTDQTAANAQKIQVRLPGQLPNATQPIGPMDGATLPMHIDADANVHAGADRRGAPLHHLSQDPAKAKARSPFRAAISAATSQSSLGPLDHPRNGMGASYGDLGHGSSSPGGDARQKNRRNSNTAVAFYGDRQVSTPSPVSFMVNSEIKSDANVALGKPGGLSPFVSGSARSSSTQTPASANSVLPSPSMSTSGTWGQSSLTFPVIEPRSSNTADRDHIKNVWSLAADSNERELQNSLKDIADDSFLPSTMPLSMHDFGGDEHRVHHGAVRGDRRAPRARSSDPNYGHYSHFDANDSKSGNPDHHPPVGARSNGFDPTTRSPSAGLGSPSMMAARALPPHQAGGSHSQTTTPQQRSGSSFMPMQNGGHSMSSPTMQPFSSSTGNYSAHNRSQAAAAAAAARNAFGAYGYGSGSSGQSGHPGGSPNMPMYGGQMMGGSVSHGRPPFGSYASQAPDKSAPSSPYNGMEQSSNGGYSLFPTGSNQRGRGVAGLGVMDAAGINSAPIGSGRNHGYGARHYGQQQYGGHHQQTGTEASPWASGANQQQQSSSGLRPAATAFSPSQHHHIQRGPAPHQQRSQSAQQQQEQQEQEQEQYTAAQQLSMYGGGVW